MLRSPRPTPPCRRKDHNLAAAAKDRIANRHATGRNEHASSGAAASIDLVAGRGAARSDGLEAAGRNRGADVGAGNEQTAATAETTVPLAVPPNLTPSQPAVELTLAPPALSPMSVSAVATPPEETTSKPPVETVVPLSRPPDVTFSVPPLWMVTLIDAPLDKTSSVTQRC